MVDNTQGELCGERRGKRSVLKVLGDLYLRRRRETDVDRALWVGG